MTRVYPILKSIRHINDSTSKDQKERTQKCFEHVNFILKFVLLFNFFVLILFENYVLRSSTTMINIAAVISWRQPVPIMRYPKLVISLSYNLKEANRFYIVDIKLSPFSTSIQFRIFNQIK